MLLTCASTACSRSTWAVACLMGISWLGLTTAQGSAMKPDGFGSRNFGPMDFGQRRGPQPPPQLVRRYQMSGYPTYTYTFPPPFGQPAQPSQASPRCPSEDSSRQGVQSAEGGVSPSQPTAVNPGLQGGFNPYPSFSWPNPWWTQQGNSPASQPGQGSGVTFPSLSEIYNRWLSSLGQTPLGGNGGFGLQPGTGGQQGPSPASLDSLSSFQTGQIPSLPPPMGGQQGQSGLGTQTGNSQWPQGGGSLFDLLGSGASGQGQSTGGPGYPSPSSRQSSLRPTNGQNPASSTQSTSAEGRTPEITTSGPG